MAAEPYVHITSAWASHIFRTFPSGILHPGQICCCADYGYEVEYTRVPVTDEKAPKEKDFALLMRRLWKPPEGAALIFNCQMGRGRTSTGMIIASLLHLRRRVKSVAMPTEPQGDLYLLAAKAVQPCACADLQCTEHLAKSVVHCTSVHVLQEPLLL